MNGLGPRYYLSINLLVLGIVLACSGCVRRRLMVRTDPPGALVSVDNQVIGNSPAASPFVYYGTREIRVERDGYETQTLRHKINAPWYQLPGIDFIAETLWPFEIRDERVIDTKLVPRVSEPADVIAGRADQLREQSRTGVATPLPPTAMPPTAVPLPPNSQTLPFGGVPAQVSQ
ncbi:PEGA domain protein [Rosistilla oblonga]|nr:PEGA domain protein [Rosistilla oblonga]